MFGPGPPRAARRVGTRGRQAATEARMTLVDSSFAAHGTVNMGTDSRGSGRRGRITVMSAVSRLDRRVLISGAEARASAPRAAEGAGAAARECPCRNRRSRSSARVYADSDSILHEANHQVRIVVENRDPSPNATFIAIGVGAGQAAPAGGRVAVATRLARRGHGSGSVVFSRARACWTRCKV